MIQELGWKNASEKHSSISNLPNLFSSFSVISNRFVLSVTLRPESLASARLGRHLNALQAP
jgi:hypothetical protein